MNKGRIYEGLDTPENEVLINIYEFLKKIISQEFPKINVKVIDPSSEPKQKAKKIRKRVINV